KSAVGLGMLLAEGIGDTIRISLAADPVEEVKVGYDILKSLRLRSRGINFIACPSCLDGGVQRQQIGLPGDLLDHLHN
ncbi:4-hydroxy-3-methylbut-2-en-1-yl diphosphate synthase, partial [Pseudomonas savastanoi pv. glycinea str. race 4]